MKVDFYDHAAKDLEVFPQTRVLGKTALLLSLSIAGKLRKTDTLDQQVSASPITAKMSALKIAKL